MAARTPLRIFAAGVLLAVSLPAFANHDRGDRRDWEDRSRHHGNRVVVEHQRDGARIFERPVHLHRRVVVERPVFVERPVYVERPAPVYDPGYGPVYDARGYDPRYDPRYDRPVYDRPVYNQPVYDHGPVAYPSHREPNVVGIAAGAAIGGVIGSQIGDDHTRGITTAVGAVLGAMIGGRF